MQKEIINVYDFDKTIYDGDSTVNFYFYCLRRYPFAIIKRWPLIIFYSILFGLRIVKKTPYKEKLFGFLNDIPHIEIDIDDFWSTHRNKIKGWYLKQRSDNDLISSASPFFLLEPITKELSIRLIASEVDSKTGQYTGLNNNGEEKVRKLREEFPDVHVDEFYSDSLSDTPMAKIADKAYLVKGDNIKPWPVR